MFVGHYAVSLAARAREATPLWVFVAAAQFLDIAWSVLVIAGVETAVADPSVAEGLRFVSYPWSHSLAAAAVWSALAWVLGRGVLRWTPRASLLLALVVFSHWPLDLIVHHRDLPLWPGGPVHGLQLWDYPWLERGLESLMLLAAAGLWAAARRAQGRSIAPVVIFTAAALGVFVLTFGAKPPTPLDPMVLGVSGLTLYLGLAALAWAVDRPAKIGARS